MYGSNKLLKIAHKLREYEKIELDSPYKTELFRGYINGASQYLISAGNLAREQDLPDDRPVGLNNQMVSILIIILFILFFCWLIW